LRRSAALAAVAALAAAGLAVPAGGATYRAASTGQISDPTGDAEGLRDVPAHEPRADLTSAGVAVFGDGRVELTVAVAQPTNPATDAAWADGGSVLMWVLDTNNNGIPNYYVGLTGGTQLTAGIAPFESNGTTPVDTCNPIGGYSTARYSVTLPASCLRLPAAFGWGAALIYDADHADESEGASDEVPSTDELAPGPGTVNDDTDDAVTRATADDPRADITAAGLTYDAGHLTATISVAQPTDPGLDPNWAAGSTGAYWQFDTDGDGKRDYAMSFGGPDMTAQVYELGNTTFTTCTATATYSPPSYSVTIDPVCIGSPASVWWGAEMSYDVDGQGAVDEAPDDGLTGPLTAPPGSVPDPSVWTAADSGYWMVTGSGDVYGFGAARHFGNNDIGYGQTVDIEPIPTGHGYWILTDAGFVLARAAADDLGDAMGKLQPGEHAAALSRTPTGNGFWIFTDRGRVLPFGDAPFLGDMSGTKLNGAVLDAIATPSGRGYWMVGSDGGIFSFGDAAFSGSTGNMRLNKPVMSMAPDPDGRGYWLVASDGGIFAFDAPFYGSMGATKLNKPISGIVPGNAGYLMVAEDGGIFAFGNVAFHGSLGAKPPADPVVAVALAP
jgi:hypothetical protein